ncbi:MAG: holo-ACP synthase [Trueperaceae bacterium]|nr:holo-ACP synthase [Trueperaceae bacterium]
MIVAVGLDLVELERVRAVWRAHPERFLTRCFTGEEVAFATARRDPVPALAARFAAKEAFQKTWPVTLGWRDVAVVRTEGSAPHLSFAPHVAERLAREGWRAHVSLTHARDHAAAVVVLEAVAPAATRG